MPKGDLLRNVPLVVGLVDKSRVVVVVVFWVGGSGRRYAGLLLLLARDLGLAEWHAGHVEGPSDNFLGVWIEPDARCGNLCFRPEVAWRR